MKILSSSQTVVQLLWLLTFTTFVGVGVGMVWWPSAQTIDAYRSAAALYYQEANNNENEVRHATQLRELQRRVVVDLRKITPTHTTSIETSKLLGLLSVESKRYRVTVTSVVPEATQASTPQEAEPRGPFETLRLEITLNGRFANVLHFVSDLTRRDLLLEMNDVNISDPEGRDAGLAVVLHATLYRFKGTLPSEDDHAAGSV